MGVDSPNRGDTKTTRVVRAFADWLTSSEYLAGQPNVYAFDLSNYLAEDDPASPEVDMLKVTYRLEGEDSHPNQVANEAIGPLFAEAVMAAARDYSAHSSLAALTAVPSDVMMVRGGDK